MQRSMDKRARGRPVSLSETLFGTLHSLREQGLGYRAIVDYLMGQGVATSKSSIERCLKGLPPYQDRRVMSQHSQNDTTGGGS